MAQEADDPIDSVKRDFQRDLAVLSIRGEGIAQKRSSRRFQASR